MDLFSEYSDAFKDARGFRPRGNLVARFQALTPEGQREALTALYAETREALQAEARKREAWEARIAALGLDPSRSAVYAEQAGYAV